MGEVSKLIRKRRDNGEKTPLEFILAIMDSREVNIAVRMEAAKISMPYMHKKMPVAIQVDSEIKIIPPYLPTRAEIADQMKTIEETPKPLESVRKRHIADDL